SLPRDAAVTGRREPAHPGRAAPRGGAPGAVSASEPAGPATAVPGDRGRGGGRAGAPPCRPGRMSGGALPAALGGPGFGARVGPPPTASEAVGRTGHRPGCPAAAGPAPPVVRLDAA